ncbi:MAG TPA: hypothetical protein VK611_29675, partial [Acidimicrobiales bacterium]|nr:hypothetical protein [Acidimicrobiales bacterium]
DVEVYEQPLVSSGGVALLLAGLAYLLLVRPNGGWRALNHQRKSGRVSEGSRWLDLTTLERTWFYLVPGLAAVGLVAILLGVFALIVGIE